MHEITEIDNKNKKKTSSEKNIQKNWWIGMKVQQKM